MGNNRGIYIIDCNYILYVFFSMIISKTFPTIQNMLFSYYDLKNMDDNRRQEILNNNHPHNTYLYVIFNNIETFFGTLGHQAFKLIGYHLFIAVNQLKIDPNVRLEKLLNEKREYLKYSKKVEKIIQDFESIPESVPYLHIDDETLKNLKLAVKFRHVFDKRTGYNKRPYYHLGRIFYLLNWMGIGQTKQINLIYDIFSKLEIEDYGKGIHVNVQKDRIRKIQEKAIHNSKTVKWGWDHTKFFISLTETQKALNHNN